MPYRALDEALEQRRVRLTQLVSESEERRRRLEEAEAVARQARAELAAVSEHIEQRRVNLPIVQQLRVATPCPMKWDDLLGDGHVRFCQSCMKDVYDLSSMTTTEITRLLHETGGDLCGRLRRKADGTVIAEDCPRGVRRRRLRYASAAAAAVALTSASLVSLYETPLGRIGVQQDAEALPISGPYESPSHEEPAILGKLAYEPDLAPFPSEASLSEERGEVAGTDAVSDETLRHMKRLLLGAHDARSSNASPGASPDRRGRP